MHGIRRTLLEHQVSALRLPLHVVSIPPQASNEIYQCRMEDAFRPYRGTGVTTVAFGDLFLSDIRRYREEWLTAIGMSAIFPLWERDTAALARRFVELGFKAVICL